MSITFTIVFVILQLLLYGFNRTINWLCLNKLSLKQKRILLITSYILANTIILAHIFRLYPTLRVGALILIFLFFSAIVRFVLWILQYFFQSATLRFLYPVGILGLFGLAVYNAYMPTVVHHQIQLDKPMQPLRIGLATDLHIGSWLGSKELDRLAEIMQQQKVDIILLPGDIMDDNTHEYLRQNMQPHLAKLQAPLGVYATLGNHDIKDLKGISTEIKKVGIRLLQDETITLPQGLVLVGRSDDAIKNRPTTAQLLENVDLSLPIVLLDHRPTQIEQHSNLPIDIQLSGHTHHGQIFPLNFVVDFIYPLAYGYKKIGNTHFFVSSGYGFWGIPLRFGSQSEVVVIEVSGSRVQGLGSSV